MRQFIFQKVSNRHNGELVEPMQVALLIIGIILVSTGIQGTQGNLASLLVSDFQGAGSFWYFIVGITAAGALGYYSPFENASKLLLLLIILVLLLSNTGFFAQLQAALASAGSTPSPSTPPLPIPTAEATATKVEPSSIPGVPTLSTNPYAGLPTSVKQFFTLPSLNPSFMPGMTTPTTPYSGN